MSRKIAASISDTLLHVKDSDLTEKVVMPITRYKNVLNAPRVVTNKNSVKGAPFLFYETDSEELTTAEIRKLANGII